MAHDNGALMPPSVVAELGPGDSLGIGLAALLAGANKYFAFDVVQYATNEKNIEVLDDLVELFKKRAKVPDDIEFPFVKPHLTSYDFPHRILSDKRVDESLNQDRIESIRRALLEAGAEGEDGTIQMAYLVPWHDPHVMRAGTVDMIYSQAALEHVDDLSGAYNAMHSWLKPHGLVSHQIDFKCHGMAKEWNGHWQFSDRAWRVIRGNKPYLLNREPHSTHIRLLQQFGFKIVRDIRITNDSGLQKKHLASRFQTMSDDDAVTCGAFIQALKME